MATQIGPLSVKVDGNNVGTEGTLDIVAGTNVTLNGGNTPGVKNTVTVNASSSGGVPSGAIFQYGGSAAPSGYLLCDGTAVSRTTYSGLFAVFSTTYGVGDGSTTFNLPDFRGRMAVGKGTHTDVDALGDNEGEAIGNRRPKHKHSNTVNTTGSHSHGGSTGSGGSHTHSDNSTTGGGSVAFGGDFTNLDSTGGTTGSAGDHSHSISTDSQGSHTHTITVGPTTLVPTDSPAYLTVNFICKT